MDFSPDENQRAVAELAAEVLSKESEKAAAQPGAGHLANEPARGVGYDEGIWAALAKAGLLSLAVPVELGGDGLGVGEVAVLLTEIAAKGVPSPALAALALGVLPLAAHGSSEQQAELLPAVAAGTALLTAAPSEPARPLTTQPQTTATPAESAWRLDGVKASVPYVEQATRVLVPAALPDGATAVFLVDPHAAGVSLVRTPSSTGQPEYTLRLDGVTVPQSAVLGGDLTGAAAAALRGYALAGAAASADGALAGALELTKTHLTTRHQFGKPLAAFQAVAQQVADVYIASRTLHLAAASAAWRLGRPDVNADEALELAAYWLAAQGLPALRTCHHLHGGLGVDVTYPLHRYYSAIKDLTRFVGGPTHTLAAFGVAARTVAAPVAPADPQPGETYIELTAAQRALEAELREYFSQLMTDQERTTMLTERHGEVFRGIVRRMGRDQKLGVGWPKEYGGHGFGPVEQHIFVNEASRADVQLPSVTLQTVGPTLQEYGTEEQKNFFLPKILSGELHFAIGYSEPDAGTDLAALRTSAVREGDHYIVNGQKIFTTGGHDADYIWLAVRTDPTAPKHKGISILIMDTSDPGYSWTPIITCDGAHHVNATYYSDVRVPVDRVVGAENQGWRLITTQLNHERVMLGPAGRIGGLHDQAQTWAEASGLLDLPQVRVVLSETLAAERINELLNWQVAAAESGAAVDVADASATKIFGSEVIQQLGAKLEELIARYGDLSEPATAKLVAWLDVQSKRNLVLTFGGGVNEIQRELIAMMGLGLPRVPR